MNGVELWCRRMLAAVGAKHGEWAFDQCLATARDIVVEIKRGRL